MGSIGSDSKTYLRGQNIPVDAQILQEREAKRQKALELQNAIKRQLEERDRQRKEEKERRLREERLEEERIKREREKEKERQVYWTTEARALSSIIRRTDDFYHRFEDEQRKLKDREAAKLRQAEAMREVLEAAERLAKEQKKFRRKCEKNNEETSAVSSGDCESNTSSESQTDKNCPSERRNDDVKNEMETLNEEEGNNVNNNANNSSNNDETHNDDNNNDDSNTTGESEMEQNTDGIKSVQVPVSKDVAIVLSGRLEDSDLLNKANLQLVNLVLTPTPRKLENNSNNNLRVGLSSLVRNVGSSNLTPSSSRVSKMIVENRLLTPSKYRATNGRDFGTQTDIENDQDCPEKVQDLSAKDTSMKDRKDATNAIKRDIEK